MEDQNKLEAIQEELTVAPEELSEQELNEIAGGASKSKDEDTIRSAATVLQALSPSADIPLLAP